MRSSLIHQDCRNELHGRPQKPYARLIKHFQSCALAMGALAFTCGVAFAADAADVTIHPGLLVSNKNADSSGVEAIIADIIKPEMSDQEKAEAIFHYVVTHYYHHLTAEEPNGDMLNNRKSFHENTDLDDTIKQLNVYAHGLCGSQSKYQNELYNTAGFVGRVNGLIAHTAPEVKYDGSWHYLDADMMGFVRDKDGKIPSIDDIEADKSLLFKKNEHTPDIHFQFDGPKTMWGALENGVKFSMYGRKIGVHSMNISLRDGESLDRYFKRQWAPDYRFYVPESKDSQYGKRLRKTKTGPERDKSFYVFNQDDKQARFGNWEMKYQPNLAKASFLSEAFSSTNVKQQASQPYVTATDASAASELVLNYYSPYGCAGTAGDLTTNADDKNGFILEGEFNNAQGDIAYSFDLGKSWVQAHTGGGAFKLDLTPAFITQYGWQIKISFNGAGAGLKSFSSYTSGQLSPASLPYVDGDTTMTYTRSDVDCLLLRPDLGVSGEEFKRLAYKIDGLEEWQPKISGHVKGEGSVIYKIDAPGDIVRVQAGAKFSGRKETFEVSYSVDDGATWITAGKQRSVFDEDHEEDFWGQSLEGFIDLEKGRAYSPGCIKIDGNVWETKCEPTQTKSILVKFSQGKYGALCKIFGIYALYKKPIAVPVTITQKWDGGEHTEQIAADEATKTYDVQGGSLQSNLSIDIVAGEPAAPVTP